MSTEIEFNISRTHIFVMKLFNQDYIMHNNELQNNSSFYMYEFQLSAICIVDRLVPWVFPPVL